MNIVEPILYQSKMNPLTPAICTPGSEVPSITYGALGQQINNAAQAALKSGIAPGHVVALFIRDNILHASLMYGLMRFGVATVSLRDAKVPAGIKVDAILTDVPQRFTEDATVLGVDYAWIAGDGTAPDYARIYPGNEDDIGRIILTSGSTGELKGVAFSHRKLALRTLYNGYSKGPRFAYCPRLFCDLSIPTAPGFNYATMLLGTGGTIYFLGDDPTDILQAINLHRIKGMVTSPYGMGEFLRFYEADSAFDVDFDQIICQGAMLSRELSLRTRARMCQNLYSSYGATETSSVAFGPAAVLEGVAGAVGYVLPGVTIEAVDEAGQRLPVGRDGALRIRTSHMANEYVGDPETSRTYFRDGWFYPGDLGHVTAEGLLVISGRIKTALNIGGDTVNPERVEEVIASFAGVDEAGVFATNNDLGIAELVALIVTRVPVDSQALQEHCGRRLPPSCVPVHVLTVDALPRAGQGKLDRQRLPELAKTKLRPS